jgi:hypothetical protein
MTIRAKFRRGFPAVAAGLAGMFVSAGCLVIPVDYYQAGSRRNLNPRTAQQIQVGNTTKLEVLLMLGELDYVSESEDRLGYAWSKVKALVFVGGYYSAAMGELARNHVLVIAFDEAGRAVEADLHKAWGHGTPPALDLEPPP